MINNSAGVLADGRSVDGQVRQLAKAGRGRVFREAACGAKPVRARLSRLLAGIGCGDGPRTLRGSIEIEQPFSPQGAVALERANRFGFYIPNTFDICGNDNVENCIIAIDAYAREFARSSAATVATRP
jgi:hypothetical protein